MSRIYSVLRIALGTGLLLGMAVGVLVLVFVPYDLWRMSQAREWPARKVEVVTSYALSHRGTRGGRYYDTQVCGRALDSSERVCISRVRFGGFRFGDGRAAAEADAARYPVGAVIDIYYDPQDPRERILEPYAPRTTLLVLLGIGVGFLVLPILLILGRRLRG